MTDKRLSGMQRICKAYGGMVFTGADGKKVKYVWDYARDVAVKEEDLKAERLAESERKKWSKLKAKVDQGGLF